MKSVFVFVASCISVQCFSQGAFEYEPNFSAVIVKDIRVSVDWYKSVFGLKTKTESNDDKNGYKVAIMESENLLLELIELRGSLTRDELLAGKPDGTQIQGHFKLGFKVKNIDDCLKRLAQLNIEVPQVWQDKISGKRNFIIKDPDENLIQFFD